MEYLIRQQEAHYSQVEIMHTFRATIVKALKGVEDLVEMLAGFLEVVGVVDILEEEEEPVVAVVVDHRMPIPG